MMASSHNKPGHVVNVSELCQHLRLGLAESRLTNAQQVVDDWCRDKHISNFQDLKQKIKQDLALYQSLIDVMVVPETFFFRHSGHFEFLRQQVLPNLNALNRPINILSAGCATGEEPYSLAMLLTTEMPTLKFHILACDISEANIRNAKKAVFTNWSLRNIAAWPLMQRYLTPFSSGKYRLDDSIKNSVTFFTCNLAEDFVSQSHLLSRSFDVIFCRNLMIYMQDSEVEKLTHRLIAQLTPDGWVVPSPSDPITVYSAQLSANKTTDGLIFQNKRASAKQSAQPTKAVSSIPTQSMANSSHKRAKDSTLPRKFNLNTTATTAGAPYYADEACSSARNQSTLERQVNTLLQQERDEMALERIKQHLVSNPLESEAYLLQAIIYWQQEQIANALTSLDKAIYLAPESPVPFYLSGILLQKQGEQSKAKGQLLRAKKMLVKLDLRQSLPLSQLGCVADLIAAVQTELSAMTPITNTKGRRS